MLRNDCNYDMKITQALLVLCVGSDAISVGNISDKVLKFVKGENNRRLTVHHFN